MTTGETPTTNKITSGKDSSESLPLYAVEQNSSSTQKHSKKPFIILAIALLVIAVGILVAYLIMDSTSKTQDPIPATQKTITQTPVKSKIDFTQLQAENKEIVAWIDIPDTEVDYPVLRSETNDLFYMNHDYKTNPNDGGSIFMQMINAADFSDPVTVLYGHNLMDGSMFATLHNFEDKTFFNQHEEMTIYTPGHVLTYKIIAAYVYDDRHIMNSYDFYNTEERSAYYAKVLEPDSLQVNVREGAQLKPNDKIVQLSTCIDSYSYSNQRYIVTGVLVNDQTSS